MSEDCGCCATPPTDTAIENRPGLPAVAYRAGTFATFRQELLEELARAQGLGTLTSRGSGDYTIAAIELWSAVADVLSFYQERIANESFLRTSVRRDSLLRLVRLIGYELAPGVSAQAWLAFMAERNATAMVPARTRVKSVPVAKELPSTFETMERLEADSTWNALEPFRLRTHQLKAGDVAAEFDGVTTALSPGDVLVFAGSQKLTNPASARWDVARVQKVEPDPKRRRTSVTWSPPLGTAPGRQFPATPNVYVMRQRAGVYGHNAPDWHMISDAGKQQLLGLPAPGDVTNVDRREWPQFEIYAPLNPNDPRTLAANGHLTIPPTAESVAAAAIAAAKASREAVIAEVSAAVAEAASSVANALAKANQVSSMLTQLVIPAAAAKATAAQAKLANAQAAVATMQTQLTQLPGRISGFVINFAAQSAPPPFGVGRLAAWVILTNNMNATTATLNNLAGTLTSDTLVGALSALTDLVSTFKKLSDDAGFTGTTTNNPTLKQVLIEAAAAAKTAFDKGAKVAERIFEPLGAIATEKAVEAAVRWTIDNHKALNEVISFPRQITEAQRVGIAAVVTAKFVEISFRPATFSTLAGLPDAANITRVLELAVEAVRVAFRASVAATALGLGAFLLAGSTGFVGLVAGFGAAIVLWPIIFAGILAAFVVKEMARPGAVRVADDVIAGVIAALQNAHPAAPWRYLSRTLLADRVDLDMVYPRIVRSGWVLLSSPFRDELYRVREVEQTSRTDFSLTGAVTRLRLEGNGLVDFAFDNPHFHVRETAVFGQSEALTLALDTISAPFSGTTIDVTGVPAKVATGRTLLIAGSDAATGQPASHLVTLVSQSAAPADGTGIDHTILTVKPEVTAPYALDGLTIYGNVTYATNGETVRDEIVGDGDASQGFQKFALKKKPVSYAPDRSTGTVNSSLTVLVNRVKWDEVPTLYGTAPTDPVFTSRIADDTTLTVTFGDGVTGSRLPTGRQNVVAQYRQGIGAGGNVGAERLTTLVDRPKALRAATNPAPAGGGVDPESLAGARVAAPGSVRTFGRAVSLRDFEDSTLFNGVVAKASATWVWTGERRAIHLTVAADKGKILPSDAIDRLRIKLDEQRDPNQRLLIDNFVRVPIVIDAALLVDERHVAADVLAAARAALVETFAFEARGFGQPVFLSDTFTLLQQVPGVVSVDVNRLDLKSSDDGFRKAHGVNDALGQPQPRLLMLPARPEGNTGNVRPAELAVIEVDGDLTLSATGGVSL